MILLGLMALCGVALVACERTERTPDRESGAEHQREPVELEWKPGPAVPEQVGGSERPRVVLLHAEWCQWCRVLEADVLPAQPVVDILAERFRVAQVDVDRAPTWMDLPGVDGLPSLVFFDTEGRHVLTKSGYRSVSQMKVLLRAVADKLEAGELEPYARPKVRRLGGSEMTPRRARAELERLESKLYLAVNSNNGGFSTPSRHPYPALLDELARWREHGGPERVSGWVGKTVESALRGSSPRLRGAPRKDMDFDADELRELSRRGEKAGARWREGVEALPNLDPYLGIQDQVDHGIFRYAAGPGWYHPHFERMAADNLAWVLVLRRLGRSARAKEVEQFVEATYGDGDLLRTSQVSDPFYYRLRGDERDGLEPPDVPDLHDVLVQARAARVDSGRCAVLLDLDGERWPRQLWGESADNGSRAEATPDAVGELLLALTMCPGDEHAALTSKLVSTVKARWTTSGLPDTPRLHRLAAGLCAASPEDCPAALAAVEGLEVDLSYAPALVDLQRLADSRKD